MWIRVLLLAQAAATILYKCCEPDAGLFWHDDVPTCELISTSLKVHSDAVRYGLPEDCNISVVPYTDNSYCVDKLEDDVVGLVCENETYMESSPIFKLRKCCANGWYDPEEHVCSNNTNGTFFPESELLGNRSFFVNVVYGIGECGPGEVAVDLILDVFQFQLLDTGALLLNTTLVETYCLDGVENGVLIKACLDAEIECKHRTCIQKCCSDGYSMIMSRNCEPSNYDFKPDFYMLNQLVDDAMSLPPIGILSNFTCENDKFILLPNVYDEDKNYLQISGELYVPASEDFTMLSRNMYCLEKVVSLEAELDGIYAFLCFPDDESEELSLKFVLCSLGLITSSVFLLITFLVYACLPNLQNLHGKTLMCHVASLFTAYVCLTMAQLGTYGFSYEFCAAVGYCILFTFVAAFSWLNIMCFDIWWTFGVVRNIRQGSGTRKYREKRRFVTYSIYAWGVPTVITSITAVMDIVTDLSPPILRPDMGSDYCWFSKDTYGIVVYFFGPVSPMIICNVVFFFLTARSCSKVKAEIQRMQQNSLGDRCKRRFQADKTKLIMNGKLFIVMGVTWALEILSSLVTDPPWIWYLSDAANALQGALIFGIFVLKRRVLYTLAHRFGLKVYVRPNRSELLTTTNCFDPNRVRKVSSNTTLNTTTTDTRSARFSTTSSR